MRPQVFIIIILSVITAECCSAVVNNTLCVYIYITCFMNACWSLNIGKYIEYVSVYFDLLKLLGLFESRRELKIVKSQFPGWK